MKRQVDARELVDEGVDARQLAGTLQDLSRINRRLGGSDLSWRALRACLRDASPGRPTHLLDVGTGAADIPRELLRRAAADGVRLTVTAVDPRPDVIALARGWASRVVGLTIEQLAEGDLPYPDGAFDIVHASLVLHHLEPPAAAQMLAEMGRVSRRAVIVNDLVRARRWWLGALLLTRVATRNRYTRHDAPLSVRRAYLPSEVAQLAEVAGLRPTHLLRDRLGHRFALVLEPG